MTIGSQHDRNRVSGRYLVIGDHKYNGHSDNLLRYLGKGRNMGFLDTIVITVDAGVEGGKGDRNADDRKIRRTTRFHQDNISQKFGVAAD